MTHSDRVADSGWPVGARSGDTVLNCLAVTGKFHKQFSQKTMREDTELGPSSIQRNPQTTPPLEFSQTGFKFSRKIIII